MKETSELSMTARYSRTLCELELFNEQPLSGGFYFALDKLGQGRVYTSRRFYGYAIHQRNKKSLVYVVHIFGLREKRVEATFKTLKAANKGLLTRAQKLIAEKQATPASALD